MASVLNWWHTRKAVFYMNDIEDPNKRKKPTLYYYAVVLLVLALLNLIAVPAMNERKWITAPSFRTPTIRRSVK